MKAKGLRLRSLMVAIAVIAIILGVVAGLKRRRDRLRGLVVYHFEQTFRYSDLQREADGSVKWIESQYLALGVDALTSAEPGMRPLRVRAAQFGDLAAYHARMLRKYRLAAARPWEPLESDPPLPPEPPPEPKGLTSPDFAPSPDVR